MLIFSVTRLYKGFRIKVSIVHYHAKKLCILCGKISLGLCIAKILQF